ncbi:MAG: hypothetical protein HY238_28610 [Acidobacteria bacterium]|nr:hypothetical protein [Acidobacteriota bacterium]
MTFSPEVEARFNRIEDVQLVAAELLDRFERRTEERMGHLEAVLDALQEWRIAVQQWRKETEVNIKALIQAELNSEAKSEEMKESIAELSRTVDRFLKARTNGGES